MLTRAACAGLAIWMMTAGYVEAAPRPQGQAGRPAVLHSIPRAFRGRWDEMQSDKCRDREPRYTLEARGFDEFEVAWDVTSVTLYSPSEIDIHVVTTDDGGRRVRDTWGFKLVRGGAGLVARAGGGTVFRRCPDLPDDR